MGRLQVARAEDRRPRRCCRTNFEISRIEISRIDGFIPTPGLEHAVIDVRGVLSGEFAIVVSPDPVDVESNVKAGQVLVTFDDVSGVEGDVNGDGFVDVLDLLLVLGAWGPCPVAGLGDCPTDLDGSGATDVADLLIVLANWT